MKNHLIKKSLRLHGHATSIALENEFWDVLAQESSIRNISLTELVLAIDEQRDPHCPLTSSLRVYALNTVKTQKI